MKYYKILILGMLLVSTALSASAEVESADLAGAWYPGSEQELRRELNSYLEKSRPSAFTGKIVALISPHAGFRYSGPVAAYGFNAMRGRGIKTVVIVGFSHRKAYDGIAVLDADGFQTPLGIASIDRKISGELIEKHSKIYSYPAAFSEENSVEMEIPFLQAVLVDFKMILIAIGNQSLENCTILGEALYETFKNKEKYILVASTDMSHYLSYEAANELDKGTISSIEKLDGKALYATSLAGQHRLMCGYGAVCATMLASEMLGADKVEILKYANSGDTAGDKSRVVGYLSAALVKSGKEETGEGERNMLNEAERKKMLKLARDSIVYNLQNGKKLSASEDNPVLNTEMGAFVTLKKDGELRGCIGNMVGRGPFYLTVRDMAVAAATADHRFRPVTLEEMENIDIEISALSPLEKITDPEKIEAGKHGVIVKNGFTSGVYLPQVATEQNWDREQFMNSLCGQKAGMAPDAWKKGKCEIYIFTAEVFGEKEGG